MMRSRSAALPMTIAALALSVGAAFAETGIKIGESEIGPVLTDSKGMTLYTYDKDQDGVSTCYGKCAENWPPLIAPAGATKDDDFDLAKRTDGTMQWTYYGKPLYLWIKDTAPGEVAGDGVGGVWHVAKPE